MVQSNELNLMLATFPRPVPSRLSLNWPLVKSGSRRHISKGHAGILALPLGVLPGFCRGTATGRPSISRQSTAGPTLWRRPQEAEANDAQHELKVRLDALRLLQEMHLPSLPQSLALEMLREAVSTCPEAQQEEMEGHCAPEQLEFLRSFVAERFGSPQFQGGLRMCQIGFNAGHSAAALLDQAPEGSVLLSLDLGQHGYTRPLEEVVSRIAKDKDQTHILLEGNSAEMLPRFRHIEFDLIFIDGNHAYEAVKLDVLLCLQMATEDTLVLLNHVFTDMTEGLGPTKVWLETLREGEAKQIGWHSCCSRHGIAIAKCCASQNRNESFVVSGKWMQTVLRWYASNYVKLTDPPLK
ncbi:unnamed protein product [Cladocopium goreaui]|uniref:Methyltransferase domain-containing protein n=1 Tax=Cladocopium goreaui TaxID=2562237 RepID=A0A9P1FP62_9DINO|nr:unnamed protein product [Cladocopium goreaui]